MSTEVLITEIALSNTKNTFKPVLQTSKEPIDEIRDSQVFTGEQLALVDLEG